MVNREPMYWHKLGRFIYANENMEHVELSGKIHFWVDKLEDVKWLPDIPWDLSEREIERRGWGWEDLHKFIKHGDGLDLWKLGILAEANMNRGPEELFTMIQKWIRHIEAKEWIPGTLWDIPPRIAEQTSRHIVSTLNEALDRQRRIDEIRNEAPRDY